MKKNISPISDIIRDAKRGKMFILVDDKNRENEGDLVIPDQNAIQSQLILWPNTVEG